MNGTLEYIQPIWPPLVAAWLLLFIINVGCFDLKATIELWGKLKYHRVHCSHWNPVFFFFPWINSPYIAASFLLISRSEKADSDSIYQYFYCFYGGENSDILILPLLLTCIKGSFLIVIFLLHLLAGILYRTFPHQLFSYHLILVGKNDRINAWQESCQISEILMGNYI